MGIRMCLAGAPTIGMSGGLTTGSSCPKLGWLVRISAAALKQKKGIFIKAKVSSEPIRVGAGRVISAAAAEGGIES